MQSKIIVVFVTLVLILSGSGSTTARNDGGEVAAQYRLRTSSSFRYAIVHNELAKALPARQVWVLIEEKAFTEENLKSLYQLVTKRYPEPYYLNIWVYTSLQDVPTPEEADRDEGMSEVKDAPPLSGAPTAVCVRNDANEYINYYYPTQKGQEHRKIIIRAPAKQKSN
jgi:hypothetical protein